MCDFYATRGVNPGRTGFDLALEAEETLADARQTLTDFFGGSNRDRLVFSYNVTDALNLLISSVLSPGDHAITTCLEHNSVLRPLYLHRERGVDRWWKSVVSVGRAGFCLPSTPPRPRGWYR